MAYSVILSDGTTSYQFVYNPSSQTDFKMYYGMKVSTGEPEALWHSPDSDERKLIRLVDQPGTIFLTQTVKGGSAWDNVINNVTDVRRLINQAARYQTIGDVNKVYVRIQPDGATRLRRTVIEDSGLRISSFGEDEDGVLFATHLESSGTESGRLYKVVEVTDRERLLIRDEARDPATGRLSFTFGAIIGKFYQPEVSTDLATWQPIGPVLPANDVRVPFAEPPNDQAGQAPRYFRVREL